MKKGVLKISLLLVFLMIAAIYLIPAPQHNFFELYPKNDKPAQLLKEFNTKPTKKITINGVIWEYYSGGKGEKTILFLHGMGGDYKLFWQQIAAFENDYKIISYTLPEEISSLENTANGILKILEAENVNKFYAVGTSMGGYITQYLAKIIPSRVEKAVFGNTFPPNDLIAKENAGKSNLVPLLPELLVSKLGEKKLDNEIIPAAKNNQLLKVFLGSIPFSKKQFINRYHIVIDRFSIFPDNYEIKRISKLIIESDNDPLIPAELRKEIKNLYQNAEVYTFHKEGHFPYISAVDEYNKVLKNFLNQENEYAAIENTLKNYFEGRKNADLTQLQNAFSEDAKLYTLQNNTDVIISLEDYLNKVKSDGAQKITTQILNGDITNDIANFKTEFKYADTSYTDYLTLIKTQNGWKIMNKTFTKTNL
ncbi:MAG: alpha/beta fold hydrolase [Lutibacter sp.]